MIGAGEFGLAEAAANPDCADATRGADALQLFSAQRRIVGVGSRGRGDIVVGHRVEPSRLTGCDLRRLLPIEAKLGHRPSPANAIRSVRGAARVRPP